MTLFFSPGALGFFDDALHASIPADVVEITEVEHATLLNGQAAGQIIETGPDGRPVLVDPPPPPIAELAARAAAEVRRQAGATRDAWRTPGKDAVYGQKVDEAAAWRAAGEPADLTAYPHIAGETGITAPTAGELVTLWEAMAAAWIVASAQVEATEQGALKAIREAVAADNRAAVQAVPEGLSWPQPPLEE